MCTLKVCVRRLEQTGYVCRSEKASCSWTLKSACDDIWLELHSAHTPISKNKKNISFFGIKDDLMEYVLHLCICAMKLEQDVLGRRRDSGWRETLECNACLHLKMVLNGAHAQSCTESNRKTLREFSSVLKCCYRMGSSNAWLLRVMHCVQS